MDMDDVDKRNRGTLTQKSQDVAFDLIGTPYQEIAKIGCGAYGVVCSAIHKPSGDKVAIKKIPAIYESSAVAKRTAREIKILRHFRHVNIVGIRDIIERDRGDLYIVLTIMETDLHKVIYSGQSLTLEHIRWFLYQLLAGLKFIHSANVIHRDLKPSNLLVNGNCHLKIGDFGMARGLSSEPDPSDPGLTQYVATRWYRAPEMLLMKYSYTTAVDMWSVGCILAEMFLRKPLFPGKNFFHQLTLICQTLGRPSPCLISDWKLKDLMKNQLAAVTVDSATPLPHLLPSVDCGAMKLLQCLVLYDPVCRATAEVALECDFVRNYHSPSDEPRCATVLDFNFEKQFQSQGGVRAALVKEVQHFRQAQIPTKFVFTPVPKEELLVKKRTLPDTSCTSKTSLPLNQKPASHSHNDLNTLIMPTCASDLEQSDTVIFRTLFLTANTGTNDVEMLSAKMENLSMDLDETQPIDTLNLHKDIRTNMAANMATSHCPSTFNIANQKEGTSTNQFQASLGVANQNETSKTAQNTIASNNLAFSQSSDNILTNQIDAQKELSTKEKLKQAIELRRNKAPMKPGKQQLKQREKEERRRKKKEKLKRRRAKGSSEPSLTLEDKSLLERWRKMQEQPQKQLDLDELLGQVVDDLQPQNAQIVSAPPSATESLINDCLEISGLKSSEVDEMIKEEFFLTGGHLQDS